MMTKRIVVVMMAVGLCALMAGPAWAVVEVTGDTSPVAANFWWQAGGDVNTDVRIGDTGVGEVLINGGSVLLLDDGYLGYGAGSSGTLTVDGAGTTWAGDYLGIGYEGHGELDITNGAQVTGGSTGNIAVFEGSSGIVRIDGVGSYWAPYTMYVGSRGDGELVVSGGAVVTGGGRAYFGSSSGSSGKVTIDGAGSELHAGSFLYIGDEGDATLTISDGGLLTSTFIARIGAELGSTGKMTVDGAGSRWDADRTYVGVEGDGTLAITNGGRVDTRQGTLGGGGEGEGEAAVDGAGATLALAGCSTPPATRATAAGGRVS